MSEQGLPLLLLATHTMINWEIFDPLKTWYSSVELIRQADITTVTARGIRKQIETLTGTSLANLKRDFDEMIKEIYDKITDDVSTTLSYLVITALARPQIRQLIPY